MKTNHSIFVLERNGGRSFLSSLFLLLVSLMMVSDPVEAAPYIPQSDDKVVEYLPEKISLFANNADAVANSDEQRIKAYLQQAKINGDGRYISYAQNILHKWLREEPAAENARLLKARIQQYNHKFDEAMQGLKLLLLSYPENIEAWSLLANLQLLTGDYEAAVTSCKQLSARSGLVDAVICQSNILIRTGSLDKADKMLNTIIPVIEKMAVNKQLWVYISQAEIKLQQDDNQQAGRYLEQAKRLTEKYDIDDAYLSRLYVDYLVQNDRFRDAFALIKNVKNDSALMIRAAVLAKYLGESEVFKINTLALMQNFEVEKRRAQSRHLREQALFTLLVLNNPQQALKLAKQNWAMQKEPEDARILMKAALSVADAVQYVQARELINSTGLVDQRLHHVRLRISLL